MFYKKKDKPNEDAQALSADEIDEDVTDQIEIKGKSKNADLNIFSDDETKTSKSVKETDKL